VDDQAAYAGDLDAAAGFDLGAFIADPTFWALVGLVIFIGIVVYLKVPRTVTGALDARAEKISAELAAAEALRKEAEAKLAEAAARQAAAEADAIQIVEAARREAAQLAEESTRALKQRLALREKLAEERIARAEADAVRDVKIAAVDTASRAAAAILTEQLVGKAADAHFASSLEAVKKALA
jgi:F-type H+-transporting ATPase subunit b